MDDARTQLTAVVTDAARQIATVLDQNPVRGNGPYPLAEVRRQLAEHHAALQRAVQAYPLALAMNTEGRPDKLGSGLAELMGLLHHVLVLYHNLTDIPDHLRRQAHRELSATHLRARQLRDRGQRRYCNKPCHLDHHGAACANHTASDI